MESRDLKNKLASLGIVWCLVFSLFAGLIIVGMPLVGKAALPSNLPNGDVIIGSDYEISNWQITGSIHYMDGNLTIKSGGIVHVDDGGIAFTEDCGPSDNPMTSPHVYTLTIEDGGQLILDDSILTTHLDQIYDFPSLGVIVQNGGRLEATDGSTIEFPGHLVVDNSTFVLSDSTIRGHDGDEISTYCNQSYFPEEYFDCSPVLFFSSSQVLVENSTIEDIFSNTTHYNSTYYNHAYSFVADNSGREDVTYELERMPSVVTSGQDVGDIRMIDQRYVDLATGNTLSTDLNALNGLVFDSQEVTLHVEYHTDAGYSAGNSVSYAFENGAWVNSGLTILDTAAVYDTSINQDVEATAVLPAMSSEALSHLDLTLTNTDPSAAIHINKVWFTVDPIFPAYRALTVAEGTKMTVIDSMIGVDFSNDAFQHDTLQVYDTSACYLYGAFFDDNKSASSPAERQPAVVTNDVSTTFVPLSKGPADNTGSPIRNLTNPDAARYGVSAGQEMSIASFNTSGLSGLISSAQLGIAYSTGPGYGGTNYLTYSVGGGPVRNTSIQLVNSPLPLRTYAFFDLYNAGIKTMDELSSLVISFTNNDPSVKVYVDWLFVNVTLEPSVYIYRWANVVVSDEQGLPVSGATIDARLMLGGAEAQYYSPSGVSTIPPAEVLNYLGKTSINYAKTGPDGTAKIPLLTEFVNSFSMPNSQVVGDYLLNLSYQNVSGSWFYAEDGISFSPYPAMSHADQTVTKEITVSNLYLDKPDIAVVSIVTDPPTVYVDSTVTIDATVSNLGLTGARNVYVVFFDGSKEIGNTTIPSLGAGESVTLTMQWQATPAGAHTITVKADPNGTIIESRKANNDLSVQVQVLLILPDLAITSSSISIAPGTVWTDRQAWINVTVSNALGRADAKGVTVAYYIGDPATVGKLIGTSSIDVTAYGSNTTSLMWMPSQIGTYDIYVVVNPSHNPAEYRYDNNKASTSVTVELTLHEYDLIVSGTQEITISDVPSPYYLRGNIIVKDSGTLIIDSTTLIIRQNQANEFAIYLMDEGTLVLTQAALDSNFQLDVYMTDNSVFELDASALGSSIVLNVDGHSQLDASDCSIGSRIIAPTTSYATVEIDDSTLNVALSDLGGQAIAYLTAINVPSIDPKEGATVVLYQWIEATVLDGNDLPLPNATAELKWNVNYTVFAISTTDSGGKVLWRALSEVLTASGEPAFFGNYLANATYWYDGVRFDSGVVGVSLRPYMEPLIRNNASCNVKIPGALPDLDPPMYVSTHNPYRGDNVTVTVNVTNAGVVPAFNVLVRFKDGSTLIVNKVIAKIMPGSYVNFSIVWTAVAPLAPHNISMVVDPDGTIKEMSKNNNQNWTMVTVSGIPSLVMGPSDIAISPGSPVTNSTVATQITITVHNGGDADANGAHVRYIDIQPNGTWVFIPDVTINVPAGGEKVYGPVGWTPVRPGVHTLRIEVRLDLPNHVPLYVNTTVQVTVRNYADLEVEGIGFNPTSVSVGSVLNIEAYVSNVGEDTAYGVLVSFYFGSGASMIHLGDTQISTISVGGTQITSWSWIAIPNTEGKIQNRTFTVRVSYSPVIGHATTERSAQVKVIDMRPDLKFVGNITVTNSGGQSVNSSVYGEVVSVWLRIKNDGYSTAQNALIELSVLDSESYQTMIGNKTATFLANETKLVEFDWTVTLAYPYSYTLKAQIDRPNEIFEVNELNNTITKPFFVNAPNPDIHISVPVSGTDYDLDSSLLVNGYIYNTITHGPLSNISIVTKIVDPDSHLQVGLSATSMTTQSGFYQTILHVPAGITGKAYNVVVEVRLANQTTTQASSINVNPQASETGMPLWVWILIIVVVLAGVIIVSFVAYRGLGRMVECGECGALIPESAKKCPKCGTTFETGTAKCSQCGAWIPASATTCPECGAKFVTEPMAEEEDEYIKGMRRNYEAYVDTFREQGKAALGKKYNEQRFLEWYKKQPSYISFEKWLSQEEEKRKTATAFACPVCGTLNPRGSTICHKCGTVFGGQASGAEPTEAAAVEQKPIRRIVRRPAEKKVQKPSEGVPPEAKPPEEPAPPAEEPKPEEPKNP